MKKAKGIIINLSGICLLTFALAGCSGSGIATNEHADNGVSEEITVTTVEATTEERTETTTAKTMTGTSSSSSYNPSSSSISSSSYNPSSSSSSSSSYSTGSSNERCPICGGKYECATCGDEDALYCEYASYDAGNDHYCSKHWQSVVKWHSKGSPSSQYDSDVKDIADAYGMSEDDVKASLNALYGN